MDISKYIKPSQLNRQKRRDKRMSEELIECRRRAGGNKNKKWREKGDKKRLAVATQKDSLPYRLSMKSNNGGCTIQDDDLEPLIRYLKTNAGRKWNDVYSDLNQQLDTRSATGLHVLEHLWDFVQIHTGINEHGQITHIPKWGFRRFIIDKYYRWFYVHPTTGILVDNQFEYQKRRGPFPKKARWKKRKEKEKLKRKLGIKPPKFKSYRCPNIMTYEQRLQIGKVYDMDTLTEFSESEKLKMRVQLVDVRFGKFGLELKVKVIKSEGNHSKKDDQIELHQNSKGRSRKYIYRSRSTFKKWKIYDAGTFSFYFSKEMKVVTWQAD